MKKENILTLIGKYRTLIMGAAALWVFAFHEWRELFQSWGAAGTALRFFFGMGFCGVDVFLLLSGMGLTHAIEKYPLGVFYKRRFARVLIPCVLTVTAAAVMRGWNFGTYLKTVTGYSFFFEDMYTVLWFAYAIMTLYLLFPLYYALFRRFSRKGLLTLGALVIWYVASIGLSGILRDDLYGFTNRIPVFLVGILLGWMSGKKPLTFSWVHWLGCVGMLLVGFACSYLTRYRGMYLLVPGSTSCVPNFLTAIAGVFLLAKLFHILDTRFGKLGRHIQRILAFYGAMSFEFYCIQELFPNVMENVLSGAPVVLTRIASFVVMSGMAWAFARVCGKMADYLKK